MFDANNPLPKSFNAFSATLSGEEQDVKIAKKKAMIYNFFIVNESFNIKM